MKKYLIIMMAVLSLSLAACGSGAGDNTSDEGQEATSNEKVSVVSINEAGEEEEIEVAMSPKKIVALDMAALDNLVSLGLGENVVGVARNSIPYLEEITNREGVENVGTLKQPDLEKIMELEPDLIVMGGRGAEFYEQLKAIAPTIRLTIDATATGVYEGTKINATKIASIFGLEDEVDSMMAGFNERIEAIKEISKDKTALVGIVTNGGFNTLGKGGRLSLIGNELGFNNIGVEADEDTASHGNEASFEYIVQQDPDYIFILDRDSAIGEEGAKLAKDIMENELVMSTRAYKEGKMIIVENPSVWYTAEGGLKALDIMLSDIENTVK